MHDSAEIICLAMKLHNFCIEHGEKITLHTARTRQDRKLLEDSETWYEDGKHFCLEQTGRHENRHSSMKRENLVEIIVRTGYRRPPVVARRVPQRFKS